MSDTTVRVRLDWKMDEDGSRWKAEMPDGRTAVIERVLGEGGQSSMLFVAAVYESRGDFVTGPACAGVLAAAQWASAEAAK